MRVHLCLVNRIFVLLLLRPYSKTRRAISVCVQTNSSLNCKRGTGISVRRMQMHGSSDTSQTSLIRQQTGARTDTGFCVTWGGFSNGLSFTGNGLPGTAVNIDLLCGIDGNCRVIETSCGWAVINVALRPEQGDTLLVRMDNRNEFAKLYGSELVTEDGEAIEGDALDDVEVFGVLTHSLNQVLGGFF